MKKTILVLLIPFFLLLSCKKESENETSLAQEPSKSTPEKMLDEKSSEAQNEKGSYRIEVEQIDSVHYHSQKEKANYKQEVIEKITDFEIAKNRLKDVVYFNDGDEDGQTQAILKIHFRNGKVLDNTQDLEYYYFIAYYPALDILLCEGGHTIDISFNLKNGKETNEVGNPDYYTTSPNARLRLNGHFGGQECSTYFIQKKINNEFQQIVQLDEEFEKQTKIWLCIVGDSFWLDDANFYLTEASNYTEEGLHKRYFKIKLIEN